MIICRIRCRSFDRCVLPEAGVNVITLVLLCSSEIPFLSLQVSHKKIINLCPADRFPMLPSVRVDLYLNWSTSVGVAHYTSIPEHHKMYKNEC